MFRIEPETPDCGVLFIVLKNPVMVNYTEQHFTFSGGFMESLDNKWILQGNLQQCEQYEKTPNTLGLKNMAGVFILVAAGIIGGIGLIIIEMVYKKHQIKKQKRMELARHAADKWRGAIEVCKSSYSLSCQYIYKQGIITTYLRYSSL